MTSLRIPNIALPRGLVLATAASRPDIWATITQPLHPLGLLQPRFIEHQITQYLDKLGHETYFGHYQFILLSRGENNIEVPIAASVAIPFHWSGFTSTGTSTIDANQASELSFGFDDVLERGVEQADYQRSRRQGTHIAAQDHANTLAALIIEMLPQFRNTDTVNILIKALKDIAYSAALRSLIVPLRPSRKWEFPFVPMIEYVAWRAEVPYPPHGSSLAVTSSSNIGGREIFDPWLRVHLDLGARIVNVYDRSIVVHAGHDQWLEWTGVDVVNRWIKEEGKVTSDDTIEIPFKQGMVPLSYESHTVGVAYEEPCVWLSYPLYPHSR